MRADSHLDAPIRFALFRYMGCLFGMFFFEWIGCRDGAVCLVAGDGLIWLQEMRCLFAGLPHGHRLGLFFCLQGMGFRTKLATGGNLSLVWSMLESGEAHIW